MRTIYKYPLLKDEVSIEAYEHFIPLAFQMQNGDPCLWAEVDTQSSQASYRVYIHFTGLPVTGENYIGTFQYNGAVFHAYWDRP